MAWSAMNKFFDTFIKAEDQNEVNESSSSNASAGNTNENVVQRIRKSMRNSGIYGKKIDPETVDPGKISLDTDSKQSPESTYEQFIYVPRTSGVLTVRSMPSTPSGTRRSDSSLKCRNKKPKRRARKSSLSSGSYSSALDSNFPFNRDKLLEMLKTVKKKHKSEAEIEDTATKEAQRIVEKVERYKSRSKENVSAELLSNSNSPSDNDYDTCGYEDITDYEEKGTKFTSDEMNSESEIYEDVTLSKEVGKNKGGTSNQQPPELPPKPKVLEFYRTVNKASTAPENKDTESEQIGNDSTQCKHNIFHVQNDLVNNVIARNILTNDDSFASEAVCVKEQHDRSKYINNFLELIDSLDDRYKTETEGLLKGSSNTSKPRRSMFGDSSTAELRTQINKVQKRNVMPRFNEKKSSENSNRKEVIEELCVKEVYDRQKYVLGQLNTNYNVQCIVNPFVEMDMQIKVLDRKNNLIDVNDETLNTKSNLQKKINSKQHNEKEKKVRWNKTVIKYKINNNLKHSPSSKKKEAFSFSSDSSQAKQIGTKSQSNVDSNEELSHTLKSIKQIKNTNVVIDATSCSKNTTKDHTHGEAALPKTSELPVVNNTKTSKRVSSAKTKETLLSDFPSSQNQNGNEEQTNNDAISVEQVENITPDDETTIYPVKYIAVMPSSFAREKEKFVMRSMCLIHEENNDMQNIITQESNTVPQLSKTNEISEGRYSCSSPNQKEKFIVNKTVKGKTNVANTFDRITKMGTKFKNDTGKTSEDPGTGSIIKKVLWPRKIESQCEPRAIPPWAEPGAKAPPPPRSHYLSPLLGRRQNIQVTPSGQSEDDSSVNSMTNKQTMMSKSKSESQLNNQLRSPMQWRKNINQNEEKQTVTKKVIKVKPKTSGEGQTKALTGTDCKSQDESTNTNNQLKIDTKITEVSDEVGHVAKSSTSSGYPNTTTCQLHSTAETRRSETIEQLSTSVTKMVTVKGSTIDHNIAGKQESAVIMGVEDNNHNATSDVTAQQSVPWRKGDVSAKATHVSAQQRLDGRKNVSVSQKPDSTTQKTSKDAKDLPDAPWRKSPQQSRKQINKVAVSESSKIASETTVSESESVTTQNISVSTSGAVVQEIQTSKPVTQEEISTVSVSESAGSSSSFFILPKLSANLSPNPANLPPHAPPKKIGGSPKGSPKGSPILPRRGAQNLPPPTPPTSSKPSPLIATSISSNQSVTTAVTNKGSDVTSVQSLQEPESIVPLNKVVPVSDKEGVCIKNEVSEGIIEKQNTQITSAVELSAQPVEVETKIEKTTVVESKSSDNEEVVGINTKETEQSDLLTGFPPPPPPIDDISVSGESPIPPPLPPPPSSLPNESVLTKTSTEENEEYFRTPVMSRIQNFEKQRSFEKDLSDEKPPVQIARPVGPWVKKTSSGMVNQQEVWNLPEEPKTWPPHPQSQSEQLPTYFPTPMMMQSEASGASKPHHYTPQQYRTPTQLAREQQQQYHPRPYHVQQQMDPQQQPSHMPSISPRISPALHQECSSRMRTASTSEELNQKYSRAQEDQTRDVPLPSLAITSPPSGQPCDGDPLFDPWCDPKNPRIIQFQDVSAAAFKIKSGIMNTPCTKSHMSSVTDMEIFFKKEFNQYTGSFKERGARYTLLTLSEEQRAKGVIAASAGNHALALSYHGHDLGIPVTVVMPLVAPIMKVQACRQYGANILVRGNDISECRMIALKMAKEQGLLYINGYDHPHILAGQGTMGLEIVEQVPNIDAVVVPVGGAGLIAGVALAVKALYPHIQVIGVESEKCASFSKALEAGCPTYVKAESTLADGLAVPMVGVNAFATAAPLVDKVVTVKEEWIAIAILRLVELEKAVVEGAGATALAAILAGLLPELKGKRVVIPLCGGNIDTTVLGRCLERGLAADGRLVKFTVTVSDRPGGIAELTRLMASLGVSIKDMTHERAWIRSDIFSVEVKALCETRDRDHSMELKHALVQRYEKVRFVLQE